jgi:hypothetical protein
MGSGRQQKNPPGLLLAGLLRQTLDQAVADRGCPMLGLGQGGIPSRESKN